MLSCGQEAAAMKFIICCFVAMIGSLLLLSTASAQSETWTRFTSHNDKFNVLMPATPTLKQDAFVIREQQVLLSYYGARRGQSDYAVVTLRGLNDANWHVAHMLMLDFYCRMSTPFHASFQKDISLDGYAGRQFSLESDERVGEWRIYEVDKTFFAIAGTSSSRYPYSLTRFFDSFSLSEKSPTRVNPTVAAAKPIPNPTRVNPNVSAAKTVSNPTGRWLVILQTFSRHERARANQQMILLQRRGYGTAVVSTDSYSNLRPGLLVLAMGPFSKRTAEQRLGELRSVAPQSYIKAGW